MNKEYTFDGKALIGAALFVMGAILLLAGIFNFKNDPAFSGVSSSASTECTIVSSTTVGIGNQTSTEIVASAKNNAYVIISQPVNATNTVALGFGATASLASSAVKLASTSTTVSPGTFVAGLNSDFPYTGSIQAITSTGSTTIGVTVCRY